MKLYLKVGFLVAWLIILNASAGLQAQQRTQDRRFERGMTEVRELLNRYNYSQAASSLEIITRRYPQEVAPWLLFVRLARESGNDTLLEQSLCKVISMDSAGYPELILELSGYRFSQGSYRESKRLFDSYRELARSDSMSGRLANYLAHSIPFALDQMNRADTSKTIQSGFPDHINTIHDEYFPSITIDGQTLVFTRQIKGEKEGIREELWVSQKKDSDWTLPEKLPYPINQGLRNGTQTLRYDGRLMIFTSCSRPDSKGGCDLYVSHKKGDIWDEPVNLGYPVNTRYWESTPALSPDGRILVFSSNRPGGQGGADLWISKRSESGSWTEPVNAGPEVNTPGDELAPMVSMEGKSLFFVSDGHPGMGQLDLFVADYKGGLVSGPVINLGFPVNTHFNEFGLALLPGTDGAVISSDRSQVGGRDLFIITMPSDHRLPVLRIIRGSVRDAISGKPLAASVDLIAENGNWKSTIDSDPFNGSFMAGVPMDDHALLAISKPGYLFYSSFLVKGSGLQDLSGIEIELEPFRPGLVKVLRNIFFDYDSDVILPASIPELEQVLNLMVQNPEIRIEISGHTDSRGSDEYNLDLSLRRAEAVRDYLISRGIQKERLQTDGKGASKPLTDGNDEESLALNRRTELRVL